MRELPPPDELLKPRDHEPVIVVPPSTWRCLICQPDEGRSLSTTVQWIGPLTAGPHGRCSECGQKYELAADTSMPLRAGMPAETAERRTMHCRYCQPHAEMGDRPTVAWRGDRGTCARCGQRYRVEPPATRAA